MAQEGAGGGRGEPPTVHPRSSQSPPIGLHGYGNKNNHYQNVSSPVSPASQWTPGGDIGAQYAGYNTGDKGPQLFSAGGGISGGVMGSPTSPPPVVGQQSSTPRPKPKPLQFDENNHPSYASPGLSTGSSFASYARTDSRAGLLQSHSAPPPAWEQSTPPPYSTVLVQPKKWYQLRQAWIMYLFFSFGLMCAVGHHIFYKSLNGKPATNQLGMLRYGTVLAFAAKAGFLACIITAFRQRIWATVRNKILSVAAIDSLFAATEDIVSLFNLEVYKKARIAMLLAVVAWLTPIVIILTSNTLGVELVWIQQNTTCPGIRTLNFSQEETEEWRTPSMKNGLVGTTLSQWNTTLNEKKPNEKWFDYYIGPSRQFSRVATLSALSQQVMPPKDASLEICGAGWNCTYTVNFTAPGYKCTELASGVGSKPKKLGENTLPFGFGTEYLVPEGNRSYYVHATEGDYDYTISQFKDVATGGIPINPTTKEPIPNDELPPHLGAFRTEPIIWIGYSVWNNPNDPPPANRSMPGWYEAFTPKLVACEHYVTDYEVEFKFRGKEQSAEVKKRTFLHPVLDTVYQPGVDANDGTQDNATAKPDSNYVYPRDKGPYRRVATFHSLGALLRQYINGTVESHPVNNPITNSDVLQTKLLDPTRSFFAYPNLPDLVQEFYEDIILSLFSYQQFVAVVWAARPDTPSGATTTGPESGLDTVGFDKHAGDDARYADASLLYACAKSRYENQYKYVERDLWIVYAAALLCALAAMVMGTAAVLENEGVLRNTKFSSIVAATRGPALEKVRWREDARGDLTPDVKKMRVGYGVVHHSSSSPSVGGGGGGHGLGVNNYNVMLDDFARFPRRTTMPAMLSPELQQQQQPEEIRYGFGLEGDVRQTRREGSLFRGR